MEEWNTDREGVQLGGDGGIGMEQAREGVGVNTFAISNLTPFQGQLFS